MPSLVTGPYIDGVLKSRSETRDAIVTVGLVNGRYVLRDPVTGGTYKAGTVLTASVAVGKRVLVQHQASGRARGRVPVVIGVSQDSDNGVISGELAITAPVTAETITRLPDLPVILTAGGLSVAFTIFGANLATPLSYEAISITDDVAQVIDARAITAQPKASGATARDRYALTVAGITIPDFFEVI